MCSAATAGLSKYAPTLLFCTCGTSVTFTHSLPDELWAAAGPLLYLRALKRHPTRSPARDHLIMAYDTYDRRSSNERWHCGIASRIQANARPQLARETRAGTSFQANNPCERLPYLLLVGSHCGHLCRCATDAGGILGHIINLKAVGLVPKRDPAPDDERAVVVREFDLLKLKFAMLHVERAGAGRDAIRGYPSFRSCLCCYRPTLAHCPVLHHAVRERAASTIVQHLERALLRLAHGISSLRHRLTTAAACCGADDNDTGHERPPERGSFKLRCGGADWQLQGSQAGALNALTLDSVDFALAQT